MRETFHGTSVHREEWMWCGAIGVADTPSLRRYGAAHHTRRAAGHVSFVPAGRFFIAFPRDNPTKPTVLSTLPTEDFCHFGWFSSMTDCVHVVLFGICPLKIFATLGNFIQWQELKERRLM